MQLYNSILDDSVFHSSLDNDMGTAHRVHCRWKWVLYPDIYGSAKQKEWFLYSSPHRGGQRSATEQHWWSWPITQRTRQTAGWLQLPSSVIDLKQTCPMILSTTLAEIKRKHILRPYSRAIAWWVQGGLGGWCPLLPLKCTIIFCRAETFNHFISDIAVTFLFLRF